jgi:hypothetical protein
MPAPAQTQDLTDACLAAEFLGHSDVRMTYNRYGEVVPEDLEPAVAQLDDSFERSRARLETSREAGDKTGGTVTGFTPHPAAPSGPNSAQIP